MNHFMKVLNQLAIRGIEISAENPLRKLDFK